MPVENDANEVVARYVRNKAEESLGRLQMEMHGEGCGCRNCLTAAVKETNSWIAMIAQGNQGLINEYGFTVEDENGRLVIRDSMSWKKKKKD